MNIRQLLLTLLLSLVCVLFFMGSIERVFATNHTSGGGNLSNTTLQNPLQSDTLQGFLIDLIHLIIVFCIPLIVLYIIYGGFQYVIARGNEEMIQRATKTITYAIVGGLLILGAEIILRIIQGTVDQIIK
jgi:NADH:ubiquinone oxidoreductase subunit 4 (subunit M)